MSPGHQPPDLALSPQILELGAVKYLFPRYFWRKPAKVRWEQPSLWSVAGPPQDTDPDPVKVRHYQELKFKVSYLKKPKYGEAAQEESPLNGNPHTTPPSLCSVPDDSIFLLLFNENVKNDKQNWSQLWTKTSAAV